MIDAAAANAEAARHALAEAEKNLDKRKVFAPADGTVKTVHYAAGEQVLEGAELVTLE